MRIYCSSDITESHITIAARKAGATIEVLTEHSTRSGSDFDHSFNVLLSGNSRRRAMHKEYPAATWDQWGVFIATLFDDDPTAKIGIYSWEGDFHFKTMGRFDELERDDVPLDHDHKWKYAGIPYHQTCQRLINGETCDAWQRWQ